MRYAMQVGYDTGTTEYYRYSQSGWFDIASTFTGLALDNYRLNTVYSTPDPMSRGEYLITGSTNTSATTVHDHEKLVTDKDLYKGRSWKSCNSRTARRICKTSRTRKPTSSMSCFNPRRNGKHVSSTRFHTGANGPICFSAVGRTGRHWHQYSPANGRSPLLSGGNLAGVPCAMCCAG